MNQQLIDKVLAALSVLAEKLGTTAEHLWGVLIKQARIEFWSELIFRIALVAATIFAVRLYKKITTAPEDEDTWLERHDDGGPWAIGLTAAALGILWIVSLAAVGEWIACLANPEYIALHKVLSALK